MEGEGCREGERERGSERERERVGHKGRKESYLSVFGRWPVIVECMYQYQPWKIYSFNYIKVGHENIPLWLWLKAANLPTGREEENAHHTFT